ncbi:MAG TPA: hypothetical protein PKE03_04705 [Bacteroidales bacterium]|nr:hypothetical protein [Bacteroidales bacterium]
MTPWWLKNLLGVILLSASTHIFAQPLVPYSIYYPPGFRVTLGVGPTTNFTDIKKNKIFNASKPQSEWRSVAQATLEYEATAYLNVRGHISYAEIAGARNNLRFAAELIEASTTVNINPFLLFGNYDGQQRWFPSIIVGIGLAHYNSRLFDTEKNQLASRGFGNGGGLFGYVIEGIAIGGIGISYSIDPHWSLRLEVANRWMSEDNLDSYVSRSPYDFYNFTILSVGYKFFRDNRYPIVSTLPPSRKY